MHNMYNDIKARIADGCVILYININLKKIKIDIWSMYKYERDSVEKKKREKQLI